MKRMMCTVVLLSVAVAILMGAGPASGQSASSGQRSIIDLGALIEATSNTANAINNRGQVVDGPQWARLG